VLSRLDTEALQKSFISWVNSASKLTDGEVIAIDGKAVRRSFQKGNRKSAIHMVSAWACQNNLVLGQQKVDAKSNEITAIPALLDLLEIKGCIITIDAMGCQTTIADKIIAQGADYVLALKGNQGELSDEVKWLTSSTRWNKLKTIIEINSTRIINNITTTENRYYISSLNLDAKKAANAVHSHWAVGNKLHWVLDVSFREDESRIRRGNGAEVMSTFRRLTLSLLKKNTTSNASLKKKRKIALMDKQLLTEIIDGI